MMMKKKETQITKKSKDKESCLLMLGPNSSQTINPTRSNLSSIRIVIIVLIVSHKTIRNN